MVFGLGTIRYAIPKRPTLESPGRRVSGSKQASFHILLGSSAGPWRPLLARSRPSGLLCRGSGVF